MWVRSQEKHFLVNACAFEISDDEIFDDYLIIGLSNNTSYLLGKYSTEEKALRVLDEIQTCIMTEHRYQTDDANCTRRFFTKEWKEIYQMPQDEGDF